MITFDYTPEYTYTCRDCMLSNRCTFTKHGSDMNKLICIDAQIRAKKPFITHSEWDFFQLRRQLTSMYCIIDSKLNSLIREGTLPEKMQSCHKHTFTEYLAYKLAIKTYLKYLRINNNNQHKITFVEELINTELILRNDGRITIKTRLSELKEDIKTALKNEGYEYVDFKKAKEEDEANA